ncbi:hypothetical protein F2Q69_00050722 [Brassica cretica]|uniref:Uncharacterized protein n=2 Tax=Brassica TaxID=3705 RepID=A0A8S9PFE3_BRACR|nr:hypothetical protein F2Q69_00050722 [Brassica cretica]
MVVCGFSGAPSSSLVEGSVGEVLPRCLHLSGVVLLLPVNFSVVIEMDFSKVAIVMHSPRPSYPAKHACDLPSPAMVACGHHLHFAASTSCASSCDGSMRRHHQVEALFRTPLSSSSPESSSFHAVTQCPEASKSSLLLRRGRLHLLGDSPLRQSFNRRDSPPRDLWSKPPTPWPCSAPPWPFSSSPSKRKL